VNSRVREISRYLATCPPRWTAINLSPLRHLASSRLATLNTQYLGLNPANPRVHEISPISTMHPSQMDGPDLLSTSPPRVLAPRDFEHPILGPLSYEPLSSRDHRSLPPILFIWMAHVLSRFCEPIFSLHFKECASSPRSNGGRILRSDLMPNIYPSLQRALFLFLFIFDGPHAVENFGWDPTISDASLPSLHILLIWKNFDSALIPPEPTLFLFVHRCTF
jgi:hypothetical protein